MKADWGVRGAGTGVVTADGPRARGYEATSVKGGPAPPPSRAGLPSPHPALLALPLSRRRVPRRPLPLTALPVRCDAPSRRDGELRGCQRPHRSPPQRPIARQALPGSAMCSCRGGLFAGGGTTSLRFLPFSAALSFIHLVVFSFSILRSASTVTIGLSKGRGRENIKRQFLLAY